MKLTTSRLVMAAALAVCALLLGGAKSHGPILQPDKLVIISTTDVKGKTGPCG